mgnify:CR=1 FL=1
MRKIESQMISAIQSNTDWKSGNTQVITIEGVSFVYLHGNQIATIDDDSMTIFDEINASYDTDTLAKEIKNRYPFNKIYIYPDASGGNRSTNATKTDIQILESYGFINQSAASNPPIRDRVNSVQRLFEDGRGNIRLKIHSSAKKLIECIELQSYTEKGVMFYLEWYARLGLGQKIHDCIKERGQCHFDAELC